MAEAGRFFPFDASTVADACHELEEWRHRLDSKGPLLRSWDGRLRRDLEAEAVAASTAMEGVPVTLGEVRRILAGDRPPAVSLADLDLVEGYRQAMGYVLRRADDPNFRWDRELLVGLHDRVLGGHHDVGAGRLRTVSRRVVNSATGRVVYDVADPAAVPALVDAACETMERGLHHPAAAAAWLHVVIAAVHPFQDGNGRVARVLASLAMYRGGFRRREFTSLEEWWGRHLADYYAAFRCLGSRYDPAADVTPFVQVHVRAQLSQVRALDMRERVLRRVYTAMLYLVETAGIDPRAVNALWDTFFGFAVVPGYYASVADVSRATVSGDLGRAVAAGFLRAEGAGPGRRYVAEEALVARLAEVLGVPVAGPADEARTQILAALSERVHALDLDRGRLAATRDGADGEDA